MYILYIAAAALGVRISSSPLVFLLVIICSGFFPPFCSQIRDLVTDIGPVVHIRLVQNKDTGKMKGFCFVEFQDYASAESATRNLNGRDFHGRSLRVDFAEKDASGVPHPGSQNRGDGSGSGGGGGRDKERDRDRERDGRGGGQRDHSHNEAIYTGEVGNAPLLSQPAN